MKTTIHTYYFDTSKPEQRDAYKRLRADTLDKIDFPAWTTQMFNRTAYPQSWEFADKIKPLDGETVELETKHLFDNQWNTGALPGFPTGARLFNWGEFVYPNASIKAGYWLDQTDEMREVLRNTHKCGFCGHQEPAENLYAFCPACLDSEYLKVDDLPLTRMQPVRDGFKPREPLTEAERAHLMPLYREAQLHGTTERGKARIAKQRSDLVVEREDAIREAQTKCAGMLWLLDHGLKIDNVIYYRHTDTFSFGWRTPVDAALVSEILDVISEFPYRYEIRCADGRKLESY